MSPPRNAGYVAAPPSYTDDEGVFSNNDLCPRYADADPSSAPPSPASVESFDILESIPWRRSYIAPGGSYQYGSSGFRRASSPREALRALWKRSLTRILAAALLVAVTTTTLILVGTTAARKSKR